MDTEKKVLFAFPDKKTLNYFSKLAEELGYTVLTAMSGKEGLIYAWRDRPGIIIFDADMVDISGQVFAEKLHQDARTSDALLVAVGARSDFQVETDFLTAGCKAYLRKSPELIPDLLEFLENPASASVVLNRRQGFQIVFLSAKGGVGTSSLCVNLADSVGRLLAGQDENTVDENPSVCAADLVLPIGSLASLMGYEGSTHLPALTAVPSEKMNAFFLSEQLVSIEPWMCKLLPGSPDPEQGAAMPAARIEPIIELLRRTFDYVFVDLGRSLSRISLPLILKADLVVVIVGNDLSAVRLTRIVLDYLKKKNMPSERLFLVLNRAVGLEGLTREEIESLLDHPLQLAVPYMRDNFTVANNQHLPLPVKYSGNSTVWVMKEGAQKILDALHALREA